MATLTSSLIVRLIDGVTGPAGRVAGALRTLTGAANQVGVVRPLQRIQNGVQQIGQQATALSNSLAGPLAIIGGFGARVAFEFEKAGNMMQALGEATTEQRREFERYANVLNSEFPQSLAEITRTGNEMLKAGFTFQQMMGAIRQTLAASLLEPEMKPSDFANTMASAINAFQLPMENFQQAMRSSQMITDRMTYAAIKTQTTLRGMGDTFRYVAAAAAASGTSLDEVTALSMALARNGIVGSEAGVALRSNIVRLVRPTATALEAMQRIGMNITDYQRGRVRITTDRIMGGLTAGGINAEPIRRQIDALVNDDSLQNAPERLAAKVTAALQEHLGNAGSAVDAQVLARNVSDAIVAAGNKIDLVRFFDDLRRKVAEGTATLGDVSTILEGRHFARNMALVQSNIRQIIAEIQKEAEGTTIQRAQIANQGIVGAVRDFSAALEGLAVAFARSALPEITAGLKSLSDTIKSFSESNPGLLKALLVTGAAIVALAPIGFIAAGVAAAFKLIAAAGTVLLGVLSPVGAVIAAVVAALAGLAVYAYNNWDGLTSFASGFASTITERFPALGTAVEWVSNKLSELFGWFTRLVGKTDASTETWRGWGVAAANAVADAIEAVGRFGSVVITKIDEAVTYIGELPGRIGAAISSGASALYDAGARLIQSLIDGMKVKFAELMDYIQSIPRRITATLSNIRLPSFLGGPSAPTQTEPDNGARAALASELQRLEAELAGIRGRTHPSMAGAPNPQADNLERRIAEIKNKLSEGMLSVAGEVTTAGQTLGGEVPKGVEQSGPAANAAGAALGAQVINGLRSAINAAAATGAPAQSAPSTPTPAGARATGGDVSAGRAYVVGERGSELFVPNSDGRIIPNGGSPRGGNAGGGGGHTLNFSPTITVSGGSDQASLSRRIREEIEEAARAAFRQIQADTGQSFAT